MEIRAGRRDIPKPQRSGPRHGGETPSRRSGEVYDNLPSDPAR